MSEFSAGTGYAGYWIGSIAAGTPLNPLGSSTVTVFQSDGSTSALDQMWTDQTKTVQASSNVLTTNTLGTLSFFADPGQYVLSFDVGDTPTTLTITVPPWYSDGAWNTVIDSGDADALSGDSHLVHADGGALTITIPDPVLGARVKVTKVDQTANVITVEPASGSIYGAAAYSEGVSSIPLDFPGASVEMFSDGSSWLITSGINVLEQAYPVGSIYMSTVAANPGTLLGFGTWEAFAEGQVIIGVGTSDETYTAGATGGASNVTLSAGQSGLSDHVHYEADGGDFLSSSDTSGTPYTLSGNVANSDDYPGGPSPTTDWANNATGGVVGGASGAGDSHTNLQPYIVAYIWNRTA